ncbi:allantoinase AllB [Nocardioidaceae bacterium SCSIO 66511]|nr:allantoinase AllB [Nocardioidaceae bacterium SCSIO 66511]
MAFDTGLLLMPYDVVFHAPRAVLPDGERAAAVAVRGGQIAAVEPVDADLDADRQVRLGDDEVLMPGLVDTHVHVNEPGRTEWEGFRSATRAAAAGGVTTLVDMPLNSIPPACDSDALQIKRSAAEGQCFVDVGFWGGAIPGNESALAGLAADGVFGFKGFLLDSGVAEFPPLGLGDLECAMREVAAVGSVLLIHAEDAALISPASGGRAYADFLASRPDEAEVRAIEHVVEAAARTGARTHIVHVSSAQTLETIKRAKESGVDLSAETCPHYLSLSAEAVPDGATEYKCCPPVRDSDNAERLWELLRSGVLDFVVSDHSPSTPDLKCLDTGDFGAAWGGIASVQLGLSITWTQARRRGHTRVDVARWMAERPASRFGVPRKGRIEPGFDADLCVFAPDAEFVVDAGRLHHRHPVTPYDGATLAGVVRGTWLRGEHITPHVNEDRDPSGRLIARGDG